MITMRSKVGMLVAVCGLLLAAAAGAATDYTWSGSANGDWFANTNWTPTGIPGDLPGDTASVTNGSILLTNSPSAFASFVITNATLTFTNWATALMAENVTVKNNGKLTHRSCKYVAPASSNRVYIVASNVTVEAGGSIDAYAVGYTDGGPGAGSSDTQRHGGGYGGYGSTVNVGSGQIYGSAKAPTDPGSSGRADNRDDKSFTGGGVVRIDASGRVTVNGTIKADGQKATADYSGFGSGGSVYITCSCFSGSNGTVSARGGEHMTPPGSYVAGGGGGRIAVDYSPTAQQSEPRSSVSFDVRPGATANLTPGTMGTVVFSDGQLVPESIVNCAGSFWLWGATNTVTVSKLTLNAATIGFGINELQLQSAGTNLVFNINGSLTLTNSSSLYVYSDAAVPSTNGLVVRVAQDMVIGSNCWVYPVSHPQNGASALFQVGSLRIDGPSGGINADSRGFVKSYGPGRGLLSWRRTGGGYGGRGQGYSVANGGGTYGSSNAPVQPGSPGVSENPSGTGGGLVRIEAERRVVVNGTITADGQSCGGYSGAGSGGGIFIKCGSFSGNTNGVLRARGGAAGAVSGHDGKAGGGGRIAVWRSCGVFEGGAPVATKGEGGDPGSLPIATDGTVVGGYIPPAGTVIIIR